MVFEVGVEGLRGEKGEAVAQEGGDEGEKIGLDDIFVVVFGGETLVRFGG